jgi:hypothetical protein
MRLIGNKRVIIYNKVFGNIYLKEGNIRYSTSHIWAKQDTWIQSLINSNFLIHNIYHNDINRE